MREAFGRSMLKQGGPKDEEKESHRHAYTRRIDAKTSRGKSRATEEAMDELVGLTKDNPDKVLVMTYIGRLVADGFAAWEMLDNGEIELRFNSGETYLLGETTILRLA
jgi:hypothetical protein